MRESDPQPGEPFEAYGLTWEPTLVRKTHAQWEACVERGRRRAQIERYESAVSGVAWEADDILFDTAEAAVAWAIRTCPGARCGSCANAEREDGELVRVGKRGELVCCGLRRHGEPADGFCHRWEAKR